MERDEFLCEKIIIHLNTEDDAKALFDYYLQNYNIADKDNTLDMHNWEQYPYAFAYEGQDGIHGYAYPSHNRDKIIEFDEWAERVGLHSYEFDESDKTLSFLFE